jgi:hypothetical protein
VNASAQHKLAWGGLRFFLGLAQLWLSIAGLTLLVVACLQVVTIVVVIEATVATIISRLLYHGKPDPNVIGEKK